MVERFLTQTSFTSEEDFKANLHFKVPENFNFAYDVMDVWAEERPDKLALLWTNEQGAELRFTFQDLKEQTDQTAAYFQSLGIGHGDKVMLILKRHYQWWLAMLGLHKLGAVALLDKPILLVYDAVGRQHLDCLYPRRMDRGILRTRHRIEFGQVHTESDRDVGVLRDDAALFDGKQREAVFQRGGFQYVSHSLSSFPLFVLLRSLLFRLGSSLYRSRRGMRRRLMR